MKKSEQRVTNNATQKISSPIIFIVGPTAVGKSEVAVALAEMINGEIVSCDAMQVYREPNILTNKPASSLIKKIPHHLINIVSVKEEFDVFRFNQLACEAIRGIREKKRLPIVTGGSGLYMQILLDGIFEGEQKDLQLRSSLILEAKKMGNQYLHDKLNKSDPEAAQNIHPNNVKRVVRALEVCLTQQRPVMDVRRKRRGLWGSCPIFCFGLNRARKELYEAINARVEDMFTRGAVEEVRALNGVALSQTAKGVIGVEEIQGYLQGRYDVERAKDLIKLHTRHLAKKQWTWFNKEKRLQWIMLKEGMMPRDVVLEIRRNMEAKGNHV